MKCLLWFALTFIAGCSSPYQFSNEIGSFSIGVDNVSSAYKTGYSNLANDRQTLQTLNFNDTSAKLNLADSCIPGQSKASSPCDFYRQGDPQPSLSDPVLMKLAADRPKTLESIKVLTDYAHALQAVTNAADRAAFNSAASRLNASVTALAKNAGAQGAAASAAFSAAFNIFAFVVGQALDQQRFDTLKQGVNVAAGTGQLDSQGKWSCGKGLFCPVRIVALFIGIQLDALSQSRQSILYDTAKALSKPLGPGYKNYTAREASAEQTLAVKNQLEQANPASQVTASLIKAHDELRNAVNDPEQNFSNFATAADLFVSLAEALKTALTTPPKAPSPNLGS
jgi:hypothetical protein